MFFYLSVVKKFIIAWPSYFSFASFVHGNVLDGFCSSLWLHSDLLIGRITDNLLSRVDPKFITQLLSVCR